MKIALLGYGKMGQIIDRLATEMGHEVVLKIDLRGPDALEQLNSEIVDVAIEFTNPDAAPGNIRHALNCNVPIVSGSTGWHDQFPEIAKYCQEKKGALFTASNFSIGVNVFFAINKKLAEMMNNFDNYEVAMREVHHVHKLDSPSGTAITLAEGILEKLGRKKSWVESERASHDEIQISSEREGEVPGTHEVTYRSTIDDIEIKHTAHSREGFAVGAIRAAEWLHGKQGVFGMQDMLF